MCSHRTQNNIRRQSPNTTSFVGDLRLQHLAEQVFQGGPCEFCKHRLVYVGHQGASIISGLVFFGASETVLDECGVDTRIAE